MHVVFVANIILSNFLCRCFSYPLFITTTPIRGHSGLYVNLHLVEITGNYECLKDHALKFKASSTCYVT